MEARKPENPKHRSLFIVYKFSSDCRLDITLPFHQVRGQRLLVHKNLNWHLTQRTWLCYLTRGLRLRIKAYIIRYNIIDYPSELLSSLKIATRKKF
jgi:hypothetical protein